MRVWVGCGVWLLAALLMAAPAEPAHGQQKEKDKKKDKDKNKEGDQDLPDGKRADVMFVLDVTGSMQFAIDGVEKGLERVLGNLSKKGFTDARVGLTVFRDKDHPLGNKGVASPNDAEANIMGDPFTFAFKGGAHFTADKGEYRGVVKKIKADGGGDIPENSLEAIKHAVDKAKARKGVSRVVVLITDAPPHPGDNLDKRLAGTRKAMLDHKYHHLYLVCREEERAIYQKIWHKEKGHHVDGFFFKIDKDANAFAGILDKLTDQAAKDMKRRAEKK